MIVRMVRGTANHKGQSAYSNVSPKKPKRRRKFCGNLSHSNLVSSRKTSPLKSESFAHSSSSSKFQSNPVPRNSIEKFFIVRTNKEKSNDHTTVLVTTSADINESVKKCVPEKADYNILHKFNERCDDNVLKMNNLKLNAKILKDRGNSTTPQTKLTEYFPVRRSMRKTGKTVLEEKRKTLEDAILSKKEDGLKVRVFEGKGRGIVAARKFYKGEFVVEYAGELITMEEAQRRECTYSRNENVGCYMYYFKHRNEQHCIDATAETNRLGRLLNHSRFGNLSTKTIEVHGVPRLILIAKEDIEPGCELTYDYGDRSKLSLQYHPWLAL